LAAAAQALGLNLADLLSLAQTELTRHTPRSTTRGTPRAPYNGLCLVA
ncbi:DNA-binding protein, partial [Streptomyces stelliscabiei]